MTFNQIKIIALGLLAFFLWFNMLKILKIMWDNRKIEDELADKTRRHAKYRLMCGSLRKMGLIDHHTQVKMRHNSMLRESQETFAIMRKGIGKW